MGNKLNKNKFEISSRKLEITKEHFMQRGTLKDRNGMNLTEAEDIKRRWQEYTELYKRYLHDPDNHNGLTTHLEPDPRVQSQVDLRKHHYEQS